jgi:hypothetical protein
MFAWFRHLARRRTPEPALIPEPMTLTQARTLYPHIFAPPKPEEPAIAEETTMSTAAVTPAVTENKFETFLSKAATDIVKVDNAIINVITAEQPLLNQILPPQYATTESAINTLFKNTMLEVEAKYAAINPTATFAQKIADVVAITAPAVIQMLAGIGVTAGQSELTALATGATAFSSLQTSGLATLTATTTAS